MSIRDELITPEQAADIRERADAYAAWVGNRRSYRPEEVPTNARLTNEERGLLEQFDVWHNPPDRLFAYADLNGPQPKITTWPGTTLGFGTRGRAYRSNFGDLRVPLWVRIAGVDYSGTAYVDAGQYCRLRRVKASRLNLKA